MFPIQAGLATSSTTHFIELHIQRARPRRPSYQEPAASALPLTTSEEPAASALPLTTSEEPAASALPLTK